MNTEETKKTDLTLVGPVRLSYANIWRPRKNLKGAMQYDVVLLFPKDSNGFCSDAVRSIKAAQDGIKECAQAAIPAKVIYGIPFLDGDKTGKNPGYWYMTAKGSYAPAVVNPQVQPITENDGWASGDWAKVAVKFYAGEFQGSWNIGCGLRSIQFVAHDEHFGGSGSGVDMFEPEGDEPSTGNVGATTEVAEGGYDPFATE